VLEKSWWNRYRVELRRSFPVQTLSYNRSFVPKKGNVPDSRIWSKTPGTVFTTLYFLPNLWMVPMSQIILVWKGFQGRNTLVYWVLLKLQRKWSVVNTTPGTVFTTLFLCNLHIGPMSKYYIILVWKGFQVTNTLVYWIYSGPFLSYKENEVL
jgi:hypothetical protein